MAPLQVNALVHLLCHEFVEVPHGVDSGINFDTQFIGNIIAQSARHKANLQGVWCFIVVQYHLLDRRTVGNISLQDRLRCQVLDGPCTRLTSWRIRYILIHCFPAYGHLLIPLL